ncbi:MAG: hypothetical protein ACT4PL_03605 [Phycisphaerales bacterium]
MKTLGIVLLSAAFLAFGVYALGGLSRSASRLDGAGKLVQDGVSAALPDGIVASEAESALEKASASLAAAEELFDQRSAATERRKKDADTRAARVDLLRTALRGVDEQLDVVAGGSGGAGTGAAVVLAGERLVSARKVMADRALIASELGALTEAQTLNRDSTLPDELSLLGTLRTRLAEDRQTLRKAREDLSRVLERAVESDKDRELARVMASLGGVEVRAGTFGLAYGELTRRTDAREAETKRLRTAIAKPAQADEGSVQAYARQGATAPATALTHAATEPAASAPAGKAN